MITYKLAGNGQFDELLGIVYHVDAPCLKPVLDLTQLTWDQFGRFFRTTGQVYRILWDGCLAGLCWIEIRRRVLLLRGLMVKDALRGRGIGTHALNWLEETFAGEAETIALNVHAGNPRARALYRRCGYAETGGCGPDGFYTMRKKIEQKSYAAGPAPTSPGRPSTRSTRLVK